jgi:beta-glucosidase
MCSNNVTSLNPETPNAIESRIAHLLSQMTLAEKIGQMSQYNCDAHDLHQAIKEGLVGSVLNEVNTESINHLQWLATENSPHGIPLLIGRDVVHGFKTIFPIPLGQAASWNPDIVAQGARISAIEAASIGINWTFAPMIDITRDPRWGRIAECLGEDPHLGSVMATAMVNGFQGDDLANKGSIAACAKHFAGYGACEAGVDYSSASIPENELRNVHLPPFKAAADAKVATFMTSFSDLNGVPATGNEFLLKQVLRQEWDYQGMVVSDWNSIGELSTHGMTANDKEAAYEAANAGVDMEMVSRCYVNHLPDLIEEDRFTQEQLDSLVANILRTKFNLGLFDNPYTHPEEFPALVNEEHLQKAKQAAIESCVLLKNDKQSLPLSLHNSASIAVIGPLADQAQEQLGTWVFDGDARHSQTPLQAIQAVAGEQLSVHFSKGLNHSRDHNEDGFSEAIEIARMSDTALIFVGEEAILSGEAHSRANIDLPGHQEQLIRAIAETGTPIVLVIMAGRPLTIEPIVGYASSILYAWHPGTMGGPAIADLLFGLEVPSGKLPVTFPRMVGQIPIYYAHKNTGRPPSHESFVHMDDIEINAPQTSLGMNAVHIDAGFTPLYPFGFGLSYTKFNYEHITLSADTIDMGGTVTVSAELVNAGSYDAEEVVQLYTRDPVANVTRPVKELKGFQKIKLAAGQRKTVHFEIHSDDLAFCNRHMQWVTEPGVFHVWIGGNSDTALRAEFSIS